MSLVKEALVVEMKNLAMKAMDYKAKIANAKTYATKEIFKKKLKKNNLRAAEIITALETLMTNKAALGAMENEALSNEGRTKAPIEPTASVE